ncbi:phosphoribosylamine--glycine ligase [Methanosphaera sp. Vir-13MRS]|jgi:phosphoribosylamine--glycine ligase|uniref:phosphoribosylamine--glycine ligase n=1 Tax=Candidatus Methanosphaera massiliense TaxID=3017187 RepID=UPI00238005BE|nr:phosphoribosylamine--glycine ligase [Candidatus Methanosphaera massiliense]MDE4077992.1 phosphoribosylamine--glycine ligase [Candidatus Methanosphaera massiliense]
MKILVVGSGAREHAIAKALDRTADVYTYMGRKNPGLARLSVNYEVNDESDFGSIIKFAKDNEVELAFIGPEAPLEKGIVDELAKEGIPSVGPTKKAAQIETNKAFMRQLFDDYNIPGSIKHGTFYDLDEAFKYIDEFGGPVVIKPIGLTGGKGVKIVGDQLADNNEAKEYVKEIFDQKMGGFEGVVIEELLLGEEYTIQAFVDGEHILPMPAAQDHPHAFEGNKGPITGGMGSYSDKNHLLPFLTKKDYDESVSIMKQTIDAIKEEAEPYKGILYGQFMLCADGPKIIEYNARFGDPESMNVLSLLEYDLAQIARQIVDGELNTVVFSNKASVCKYVVPDKYPNTEANDTIVTIDEEKINDLDAEVYYAAVYSDENDDIKLTSSRAIAVLAVRDTISESEKACEEAINYINGEVYHRRDVATEALLNEKIEHMKEIRG